MRPAEADRDLAVLALELEDDGLLSLRPAECHEGRVEEAEVLVEPGEGLDELLARHGPGEDLAFEAGLAAQIVCAGCPGLGRHGPGLGLRGLSGRGGGRRGRRRDRSRDRVRPGRAAHRVGAEARAEETEDGHGDEHVETKLLPHSMFPIGSYSRVLKEKGRGFPRPFPIVLRSLLSRRRR